MIHLDIKRIAVSTIVAGTLILVVSMVVSTVTQVFLKYNVLTLPGMRSADDPVSILFFLQPYVVALGLAILYNFAKNNFTRTMMRNGVVLGLLGWILYGIPSAFIVYSSMDYPIGFTVNSVIGPLIYMLGAGITITGLSSVTLVD